MRRPLRSVVDRGQNLIPVRARPGQRAMFANDARDADRLTTGIQSSFAWKYIDTDGIVKADLRGGGLSLTFSGQQPEACLLLERTVPVSQGFTWDYRTNQLGAGLRWTVETLSGKLLGTAEVEPSEDMVRTQSIDIKSNEPAIRLRLRYQRKPGTARISGTLELTTAQMLKQ